MTDPKSTGLTSSIPVLILFLFIVSCVQPNEGSPAGLSLEFNGSSPLSNESLPSSNHSGPECPPEHKEGISLISFRWHELGVYFTITFFVVIAGFAKIGFHKLTWISSKVPESCLLVLLGLAVGLLAYFALDKPGEAVSCYGSFQFPQFSSETFFFILLPPIILDSAYALHDRVFFDNLGTVLVFAVIGTLFNVFAIGGSLYGLKYVGLIPQMDLTLADAFVFSSLISAVDPVAVLAIFEQLGVNQNLYFLIFGESLLNDGVTVVLYNTMQTFRRMPVVSIAEVFLAILSFFIVSLGGITIGVFFGLLTALVTKWTYSVRVVEPLAILGLAYLSYVTAELFHFSGIISLIVCGILQAHYGFFNISQKSYTCVKYFTKMASATSDTIIFMFLGMLLVNENHQWNTAFVLWSIVLCLVYRFISIFTLSAMVNCNRTKAIGLEEQFIAAYGGLRGAVAFSLANTMDEDMNERNTYIFTTLMVILFTVFVQGISIRPLVHLLNIQKRGNNKKKLTEEIAETSMDHMMAGVEEILGHHGDFYLRELLTHYNEKYLKKIFMHDAGDTKLTRLFEKICLAEHYAHLYGPSVCDDMKPLMQYPSTEKIMTIPTTPIKQDEQTLRAPHDPDTPVDLTLGLPKTAAEVPLRRKSIKDFLARRSTASIAPITPPPEDMEKAVLRRAFRDNRYNKLHYTYNPNLVHEEDQEMTEHLNRRTLNAQRMSLIASAKHMSRMSGEFQDQLPGHVPQSKPNLAFGTVAKSILNFQRHHKRTRLQTEGLSALEELLRDEERNMNFMRQASSPGTGAAGGPARPDAVQHKEEPSKSKWTPETIPLLKIPVKKSKTDEDKPPPV